MPQAAARDHYAQDVHIRINLSGFDKFITEHIVPGENQRIVISVTIPSVKSSGSESRNVLNAKVDVDYDGEPYESSNPGFSSNSAMTQVGSQQTDPQYV